MSARCIRDRQRPFYSRCRRSWSLSRNMDGLDVLDPGLPIECRPQWYVMVTLLLLAGSVAVAVVARGAALLTLF